MYRHTLYTGLHLYSAEMNFSVRDEGAQCMLIVLHFTNNSGVRKCSKLLHIFNI